MTHRLTLYHQVVTALQQLVLMTDLEKLVTFYHLHLMLSRRLLPPSSSNHQHSMMIISKILLLEILVSKKILIWLHFILFSSDITILSSTVSESSDQVIQKIMALVPGSVRFLGPARVARIRKFQKKSKTRDRHRAHFPRKIRSAASHHFYIPLCFGLIFPEIALVDKNCIYFCPTYFSSYWHMAFKISIIIWLN